MLGRLEHAQAGDRVVARKDHDLDLLLGRGVEGEQLFHQLEGDALPGGLVEARELQPLVRARVLCIEHRVLFLEIEQRPGGQGHYELVVEVGRHGSAYFSTVLSRASRTVSSTSSGSIRRCCCSARAACSILRT